jgi:hypothetical protein
MTPTLQRDKDIILIPREWWEEEAELLEPVDLGWWYTVNNFEIVKFHSCKVVKNGGGETLTRRRRPLSARNVKDALKSSKNLPRRVVREQRERGNNRRRREYRHR